VLPSLPVADLRADRAIVVAAAPGAPAIQLVRIVVDESGAIAVSNHGKLAVLSRGYGMPAGASEGRPPGWVELHVKGDGVHVIETSKRDQTVVAWKQGTVDRDGLRTTYEKLKAEAVDGAAPYIEVLVGEGPTAQQLVDVLVTLDGLGATLVSLGELVGTTEARLAHFAEVAKPVVEFGQPVANGDLDKAIIRRTVKENVAKITACYETQLAAKPGLRGVVTVQFFIAPPGAVTSSTASGVDPELATCVATVIKGITFAKPKGGGGVQVNYPFVFRPHHLLL